MHLLQNPEEPMVPLPVDLLPTIKESRDSWVSQLVNQGEDGSVFESVRNIVSQDSQLHEFVSVRRSIRRSVDQRESQ